MLDIPEVGLAVGICLAVMVMMCVGAFGYYKWKRRQGFRWLKFDEDVENALFGSPMPDFAPSNPDDKYTQDPKGTLEEDGTQRLDSTKETAI